MHQHLTTREKATAYRNLTDRFYLRHQQRTALDALDALDVDAFRAIRQAAHERNWAAVEKLLHEAGIIESEAYA